MNQFINITTSAFIVIILATKTLSAQYLSIGEGVSNSSAAFEMNSTTQGFLIPRMTTEEIMSIVIPTAGLQVYSTDDKCIYSFDGLNWNIDCGLNFGSESAQPPVTYYWDRIADFPGPILSGSSAFSIGGKGYIVGGQVIADTIYDDFYSYDPAENSWSQLTPIIGGGRSESVAFTIGNEAFVGTGWNGTNFGAGGDSHLDNEFYKYNATHNEWTQISDFTGLTRVNALAFTMQKHGYVGLGRSGINFHYTDFYKYNPIDNIWTQIPDFPGQGRQEAVVFTIGEDAYVGGGRQSVAADPTIFYDDFYKYNASTNQWTQIADYPYPVSAAVGFSIGNEGFVGTGFNTARKKEFYKYDPSSDSWEQIEDFNAKRYHCRSFTIGNKAYVGFGYDVVTPLAEFRRFTLGQYNQAVKNDGQTTWSAAMNHKRIQTTSATSQGAAISIPSGLAVSQIIDTNVFIDHQSNGSKIPANYTFGGGGIEFDYYIDLNGQIIITNSPTNSIDILDKPVIIDIIYR